MKTTVPQILEMVEKAKTQEDKVKILQEYNSTCLRGCLNINYNPNLSFGLPEGEPPFKKDTSRPLGTAESTLYTEYKRFYIWVRPQTPLPKMKLESLFIQMLEGLHHTEAALVIAVKDRKLSHTYPSVTPELVRAAFPELLPEKTADIPALPKKEKKAEKPKKESGVGSKPLPAALNTLGDLEKQLLEQQLKGGM